MFPEAVEPQSFAGGIELSICANFGDCCPRAFAATAASALLDADGGGDAGDQVDVGAGELLDELPGINVHRIEKPALTFGEKQIKGDRALAGTAHASHDDEAIARN